ncbi:hypothetical protein CDAR_77021 [Caerostris darwini]|uniref:Uncharacterized protein n=1 Tax=Caerostris darwini TaxID=1538125 RepID=A0AAV4R6P4_9ARAC|nr:hypothetical protein CDAR_77021 [Caerostris darwini]
MWERNRFAESGSFTHPVLCFYPQIPKVDKTKKVFGNFEPPAGLRYGKDDVEIGLGIKLSYLGTFHLLWRRKWMGSGLCHVNFSLSRNCCLNVEYFNLSDSLNQK